MAAPFFQKRDSNIKIIPAFKPIPADCEDSQEASPERKPQATTGRARMKGATPQEKRALSRQATNGGAASSDGGASSDATEPRNGASDGSSPSSGAGNNTPASTTSTTTPLPVSHRRSPDDGVRMEG